MDTIREYALEAKSGEQYITVPQNSHVLSVRKGSLTGDIMVGVLVDLDSDEMVDKCFLIFQPNDEIADSMKAEFMGSVTLGTAGENVFFVFEKLTR